MIHEEYQLPEVWKLVFVKHYYRMLRDMRGWIILSNHRVIEHRLDILGAIAEMEEW